MKSGNILFVHDRRWWNLVSTGIMIAETDVVSHGNKIPYHIAIVIDDKVIIESTWGRGVCSVPIKLYTDNKNLTCWFKQCTEPIDNDKLCVWLMEQLGSKYDKWQILGIFWRSFVRVIPPLYYLLKKNKNYLNDRKKFICSELVLRAYKDALGIDLYPSASNGNVTPHDLNKSVSLVDHDN